jgi:hypothetical protein
MKLLKFIHEDNWLQIKSATLNTVGKDSDKYPTSEWKQKLLLAEHSPIRMMKFQWRWELPYWTSNHYVRHKHGIEHFVKTQRTDRTGIDRNELGQGELVTHECEANAQALINISRKRLCNCASKETREAWKLVKNEVAKVEPELANCMQPECVYRGVCPEMKSCGYYRTREFCEERNKYMSLGGN